MAQPYTKLLQYINKYKVLKILHRNIFIILILRLSFSFPFISPSFTVFLRSPTRLF